MQSFCTIITLSHLPLAKVLFASLQRLDASAILHVLITDGKAESDGNFHTVSPSDLTSSKHYLTIERKYAHAQPDRFRWALKPVILGYLLEKGYTKVIFADPDIYFISNYQFLFDLLGKNNMLLTPHWADMDFTNNPDSILSVMKGGLYNAGFIGVNEKALPALAWWAGMCSLNMEKDISKGTYDDQKYLDLLPVHFENIHVLKHQGCNLASWNIQTCKREMVNGRLVINEKFEPVFIHFAKDTIRNILNRNDQFLKPYLDEYIRQLFEHGFDLLKQLDNSGYYSNSLYQVKHKLRLRTRFKRFLYKLAEKL
jgi:hypothetical protein